MSVLPILLHPDVRLKKTCEPVSLVDETVQKLAEDMVQTMYDAPGVGLAAPQVGVLDRVLVMDCGDKEAGFDPHVLINPKIVWESEEPSTYNEGCLSLPELFADVTRPAQVRVQYLDETGSEQEKEFSDLWATCVQHEIDHLDGKLFIDYLSSLKRGMFTKKMKKFKQELARDT
jgi:peptide deformylase